MLRLMFILGYHGDNESNHFIIRKMDVHRVNLKEGIIGLKICAVELNGGCFKAVGTLCAETAEQDAPQDEREAEGHFASHSEWVRCDSQFHAQKGVSEVIIIPGDNRLSGR